MPEENAKPEHILKRSSRARFDPQRSAHCIVE